ncbi:hypothetical protein B7P43_G11904 [Cryptotermes secundus]|uniref:Mos1 transposase HTH domain-containing protein n=1 Tax=Cryptotermes secundus TaxID=105785 RepID=A0A2J7Q6T8_9NEOP|nr:hypothetical protein B7P43_G11904 [Cryptotermes secundus]
MIIAFHTIESVVFCRHKYRTSLSPKKKNELEEILARYKKDADRFSKKVCELEHANERRNKIVEALECKVEQQREQLKTVEADKDILERECERLKNERMEQRSWIQIECARGCTARQCLQGLQETCRESALPYRTVARWIRAFNEGRQNVADMRRPGRPSVSEEVHALSALLESDWRHTIRELA